MKKILIVLFLGLGSLILSGCSTCEPKKCDAKKADKCGGKENKNKCLGGKCGGY